MMSRFRLGGVPADRAAILERVIADNLIIESQPVRLGGNRRSQVKVLPADSNPASPRRRTAGPRRVWTRLSSQEQWPEVADLDHRSLPGHRPHCPGA